MERLRRRAGAAGRTARVGRDGAGAVAAVLSLGLGAGIAAAIRINGTDTPHWRADLAAASGADYVVIPKVDGVADVEAVLQATGLPAYRLEIEITESLLIEDSDDVLNRLIALKKLGCAIVMDDFGTGYSSLSYLLKFPFDRLKIDRSFTRDIDTGESAKAILMAIASLGENLGIKITAEGVETADQLDFLVDIGCDQLQGFYFSQPVRHEDVAPIMLRNFMDSRQMSLHAEIRDERETRRNRSAG